MNLGNFLSLLQSNPTTISIHYELNNGEQKLTVNGEQVNLEEEHVKESFDDSHVIELIKNYKENIELLDDCVFIETMDELSEIFNIKELDRALNKEHFTEEEAEELISCIGYINSVIHKKLSDKIQQSIELLERF